MNRETFTRTAPSAWASYLINGDASGLDASEIADADAFADQFGTPIDCADVGFVHAHDAYHIRPLGADCAAYTFWEQV